MTTAHDETLDGTTRSYSRTTWQCFPSERAHCIEGPERTSIPQKAVSIAIAIAVVAVVLSIAFQGAPK